MSVCDCNLVRDRDGFDDLQDVQRHLEALEATGHLKPVPVEVPYANIGEVERWYECERCQATWRLVEPDGPFRGVWRTVKPGPGPGDRAEAPPGMRFVFVFDTETSGFPVAYQVTPADGGPYNRSSGPITGLVAEDARDALIAELTATYPHPRYVVSEAGANSWEALESSFPGMQLHWDTFSDS